MNLTDQQKTIVDYCKSIYATEENASTELVLINSVAGS
jgi:hypothetical protein